MTMSSRQSPAVAERVLKPGPVSFAPLVSRQKKTKRFKQRVVITVSQFVLLVAVLLLWEFGSGPPGQPGVFIDIYAMSKPSEIWGALVTYADRGVLWSNIAVTYKITLIGFVIGALIGFVLGLGLGLNRYLAAVLSPFIAALYSTPRLALIPVFILWFGIGDGSKIALVSSVVLFLVFFATFAGVKDVDSEIIDRMRLMRANGFDIGRKAILPSATNHIIEGLSVSGPMALVAAVTAEMLSSNSGMGFLLVRAAGQFDTAGVFASITVLALMGSLLMGVTKFAEARLLRWRATPRAN